jgi:RNA polymerase sigma factor (sigma-70 family)
MPAIRTSQQKWTDFVGEMLRGMDFVPFWTLAVADVYRKWKRSNIITIPFRTSRRLFSPALLRKSSLERLRIRSWEGQLATAVETAKVAAVAPQLEAIFREHYASVLRAAYRITGSMADAEDVAQAVFLRLARGGVRDGEIRDTGSYLRRAAVNSALDLLRSRSIRAQVPIQEASLPSNPYDSPEQAQSSAELRQRLRQVLAKLHPRTAEMFALRYVEGLDNPEVARIMQTSQAVVAVMLHRARSRLRKELSAFAASEERPCLEKSTTNSMR